MAPCGDWQQGAESAGSLLEGGGLIGHCGAPARCDVAVQVLTHLALSVLEARVRSPDSVGAPAVACPGQFPSMPCVR